MKICLSMIHPWLGLMVIPERWISLPMNMEGKEVMVTFIVVNSFSPYTTILERQWIHAMGAVLFTLHVKVKFHTEHGIAIVRGNQQVARQCLVVTVNREIKQKEPAKEVPLYQLLKPHEEMRASCAKDLIRVKILLDEDRSFQIGVGMKDKDRVEMPLLLV